MPSVEGLTIESWVIYDNNLANEIEDASGLVDGEDCVIFMEGLYPEDEVKF